MIQIIDIGGNYGSLQNAFRRLDCPVVITPTPDLSKPMIVPGVGHAAAAMRRMPDIRKATGPVLGICLGYHLMCRHTEEGPIDCLGIFPSMVGKLPVTQFGWKQTAWGWMYFCHGYGTWAFAEIKGNFMGVQFHPEKSGKNGLAFLDRWLQGRVSEAA